MTPTPDVAALQAALDAGPTPGEWHVETCEGGTSWIGATDAAPGDIVCCAPDIDAEESLARWPATRQFIAAASPDRITRVLAALRAAEQRAEAAEGLLRKARDELAGLPRSLGYDFTHLPEINAALKQGEQPCEPL